MAVSLQMQLMFSEDMPLRKEEKKLDRQATIEEEYIGIRKQRSPECY